MTTSRQQWQGILGNSRQRWEGPVGQQGVIWQTLRAHEGRGDRVASLVFNRGPLKAFGGGRKRRDIN